MTDEFLDTHIVTFTNGKRREIKIVRKSERHYNVYYQEMLIGMAHDITGIHEIMEASGFTELLDNLDKENNCNS